MDDERARGLHARGDDGPWQRVPLVTLVHGYIGHSRNGRQGNGVSTPRAYLMPWGCHVHGKRLIIGRGGHRRAALSEDILGVTGGHRRAVLPEDILGISTFDAEQLTSAVAAIEAQQGPRLRVLSVSNSISNISRPLKVAPLPI